MTDPNPTLQTIKHALDDIGAAGDAARLQIHLLSLRARERTGELASNIEALEHRLDQGLEQAVGRAATKTRQLSTAVRDLLGQSAARDGELSVEEIMTDAVAFCSPDESINAAARQMWEHDCGAVPVVEAGKLVGIITDRDICMAAYTQGRPLTAIAIRDVMPHHVHTCRSSDTLERAASLMADAQVRRLPVVDADRHLLGMVSMADIARSAPVLGQREAAELVFQLTRTISQRPHEPLAERRAAE
ncbi:MAG TPA: CBS domain-containing protein [Polyangiaceae bacterium]|nr:CBS domain-containing protein [Polyangiaceae bacterium]